MTGELTELECEEISNKIESEGFDYYFNDYGPDVRLKALLKDEIEAFSYARRKLVEALQDAGIELEF